MCFSAHASFVASAGLLVIGAVAISQAKTPAQRMLSTIPIIFSVQQASEGLLWLALSNPAFADWRNVSMYIFLFFAQVLWPTYVPLTISMFEIVPKRKKILRALLAVGIVTSLYLLYCLALYPVSAEIKEQHIDYNLNFPLANRWFTGIPYILAAVLSPFISSVKQLRIIGGLLLASYLFTSFVYHDYLISVWCYFAAILSVMVLVTIRQLNGKKY